MSHIQEKNSTISSFNPFETQRFVLFKTQVVGSSKYHGRTL